jgi:hypothetical protein
LAASSVISRSDASSSVAKACRIRSVCLRAYPALSLLDMLAAQTVRLAIVALAASRVIENHITNWAGRPIASSRLRSARWISGSRPTSASTAIRKKVECMPSNLRTEAPNRRSVMMPMIRHGLAMLQPKPPRLAYFFSKIIRSPAG